MRRTGKEGIYTRIVPDKREKFKQEQVQLEIDNFNLNVIPDPEPEKPEDDEESCMGSRPGMDLGETLGVASCPCGRYLKRCNPSQCKLGK